MHIQKHVVNGLAIILSSYIRYNCRCHPGLCHSAELNHKPCQTKPIPRRMNQPTEGITHNATSTGHLGQMLLTVSVTPT